MSQLRGMFLGVSTILLNDGDNAILTDGFFSRPGLARVLLGRVRPDRVRIAAALERFGISRLGAVFAVHSHYDHALDSAVVASLTGARLFGSASTRNIALGQGFPDDRISVVSPGVPFAVGAFQLTALPAEHSPGDVAPGTIDQPLGPAPRARDYKTGGCYTLHVEHEGRALLIHASANVRPGALDGYHASTVYLGIGTLGKQDEAFRLRYWDALVSKTGARRVIPVHWDNFTVSLDKPLRPLPRFADNFESSMDFLRGQSTAAGVELALPTLGEPTDPFPAIGSLDPAQIRPDLAARSSTARLITPLQDRVDLAWPPRRKQHLSPVPRSLRSGTARDCPRAWTTSQARDTALFSFPRILPGQA